MNLFYDLKMIRNTEHSFAAKRMRHMTFTFIFALCPLLMHAQTFIGIDLPSLLHSELQINFGHRISEHWSMSASSGLNFRTLYRKLSTLDAEHNTELDLEQQRQTRDYMHRESADLCYWPQGTFKGVFLAFGAAYTDTNGLDGTVGAGYMFSIWKRITGYIRYDTGLTLITGSDQTVSDGLRAGISWIF